MNGTQALHAVIARVRRELEPERELTVEIITDATGPVREGWHDGRFYFTMRVDKPIVDAEPAEPNEFFD